MAISEEFERLFEMKHSVDPTVALDLLSPEQRNIVVVFHLMADLQYGLTDFFKPQNLFEGLTDAQREQVIKYFRSMPMGLDYTEVLTWYESEQAFRVERNIITPAHSR